jgi:hypothetical protein
MENVGQEDAVTVNRQVSGAANAEFGQRVYLPVVEGGTHFFALR